MKFRLLFYVILSIGLQVLLGQVTGQGQGGIAMVLFVVMVELDPRYGFAYLIKHNKKEKKDD